MGLSDRLTKLESRTGDTTWAGMCNAHECHTRRIAYREALRLAEKLGVEVHLEEPPEPNPVALAAFERKYGEAIRANAPATLSKFKRLLERRAGVTETMPPKEAEFCIDRMMLDFHVRTLSYPERVYRMVA